MFKTTQQKIDKLKIKIAGLEERIRLKEHAQAALTPYGYMSYIEDKEKMAELQECLRQLEIKLIEKTKVNNRRNRIGESFE